MARAILDAMRPADAELIRTYHPTAESQKKAAAALGIPPSTFRRRLAAARGRFTKLARAFMAKDQGEER